MNIETGEISESVALEPVSFQSLQNDKFTFTPTGMIIAESTTLPEWLQIGDVLKKIERGIQFALGDWLNFGERKYGEMYAQALEETEYEYKTLLQYSWVARSVEMSIRIDNLSFTHHHVVASLEPEQQEYYLDLATENSWSVSALRRHIKNSQVRTVTLQEMLTGKYPVIYADPPWSYSNSGFNASASQQYPTMSLEDICAMPVGDYATENAVLFMWATNPLLEEAFAVIRAWGFNYKTNICWDKEISIHDQMAQYVLGQHELLLIATRGSMIPASVDRVKSVYREARSEHSRKPEYFYELIESMYPNFRYLELFARQTKQGWEHFGNEVEKWAA